MTADVLEISSTFWDAKRTDTFLQRKHQMEVCGRKGHNGVVCVSPQMLAGPSLYLYPRPYSLANIEGLCTCSVLS